MTKKNSKAPTYTRKKIVDEFTDLPISRQQKWQLRRAKEGRCVICGDKYSGSKRRNKTLTYQLAAKAKEKKAKK